MEDTKKSNKKSTRGRKKEAITVHQAEALLPIDYQDLNLDLRQLKFVALYCSNGFNGMAATKGAGLVKPSIEINCKALLNNKEVQEAIRRFVSIALEPYMDRLELECLEVYYKRAFYRIETFYDDNHNILPIKKVPEDWMVVVDGVNKTKKWNQAAKCYEEELNYQLADRDKALKALMDIVKTHAEGASAPDIPTEARKKVEDIFKKHRRELKLTAKKAAGENIRNFPNSDDEE